MTEYVNAQRLRDDFERLASFGLRSDGSVDRPAYSANDVAARQWFADRAREAGLAAHTDALLNVVVGDDANTPAVWTGSHLDTVPRGGKFDGALGAIAALECVRRLHELDLPLTRPVRAVAFADEEGSYHGFLGSKSFVRGIAPVTDDGLTALAESRGPDDRTLHEAVAAAGGDLGRATTNGIPRESLHSFVELHIEQGPNLEATATDIGIVSHIVGVGRLTVRFDGRPDHAGTTPMYMRRDALLGAAAFIDRLPQIPADIGVPEAVVTCGQIEALPGASNVVPGSALVHLDYRATSMETLTALSEAATRAANATAARHGLLVTCDHESVTPPYEMDARVSDTIRHSAKALSLSAVDMASGAGHDSQVIADVAPTGMIFVPSHNGRSHSRLEHTSWEDVTNGANVLLNALIGLAQPDGAGLTSLDE